MATDLRLQITDDTTQVLAMRLILRIVVDELARGHGEDPAAYRSAVQRLCTDRIECATFDEPAGGIDPEDFRTKLMEVVAGMLAG